LKLKVTGQGQGAVSLTSILDRGQFSSFFLFTSESQRLIATGNILG